MATTVIERLVVGLSADPSALARGLSQGMGQVRSFASGVMSAMAPLGLAAGGLLASGLASGLDRLQTLGRNAETTARALGAADPSGVAASYRRFADELERTSAVSRTASMTLLDQAGALGLYGPRAEAATRNALALADGNADLARTYLEVTAAMQRGTATAEMAAEALKLKGVKDPAVVMDLMARRIAAGQERMKAFAGSAAGQAQKLKNAFGELTTEIAGAAFTAMGPLLSWLTKAMTAFREASPEVKRWTGIVVASLAGLAAAGPVMSALAPVLGVVTSAFGLLSSAVTFTVGKVLIGIPVWAAYKTVTVAASVATALFTGTAVTGTAATVAYYGAMILLSPVLLTVKAAMMAVAVATTVSNNLLMMTNAILMTGTIAGAALSFVAMGAAITAVSAAAYGLYRAVTDTFALLTSLPSQALAPLSEIGRVLGSWGTILQGTFRALAAGEFSLAGQLLYKGFQLAVSQMKDLFPPLWAFMKAGFNEVVNYFTATFQMRLEHTINMASANYRNFFDGGDEAKQLEENMKNATATMERLYKGRFAGLGAEFTKNFKTSAETKSAQDDVDALLKKAGQLPSVGESLSKTFGAGSLGLPFAQATKEIQKYDHALAGSLDARTRYEDYLRRLGLDSTITTRISTGTPGQGAFSSAPAGSGGTSAGAAPASASAGTAAGGGSDLAGLLREVVEQLKQLKAIEANTRTTAENTEGLDFEGAGL